MEKYTAIYVAYGRYDTPMDEPRTHVDYIQGEDLDDAIQGHMKYMDSWAIRDVQGEVVIIKGHVEQVDIGHGIGHQMLTDEDIIITGVNNGQHFDRYIEIGMRK